MDSFKRYRSRHLGDRYLANDALKDTDYNDVLHEPLSRLAIWQKMTEYMFIISPHGTGLDCHRTYEALALGCIPVVRSSTLDILYRDLPVVILQSWNDISLKALLEEAEKVKDKDFKSLELQYWVNKIKDQIEDLRWFVLIELYVSLAQWKTKTVESSSR